MLPIFGDESPIEVRPTVATNETAASPPRPTRAAPITARLRSRARKSATATVAPATTTGSSASQRLTPSSWRSDVPPPNPSG
jgi:hypothetical protein